MNFDYLGSIDVDMPLNKITTPSDIHDTMTSNLEVTSIQDSIQSNDNNRQLPAVAKESYSPKFNVVSYEDSAEFLQNYYKNLYSNFNQNSVSNNYLPASLQEKVEQHNEISQGSAFKFTTGSEHAIVLGVVSIIFIVSGFTYWCRNKQKYDKFSKLTGEGDTASGYQHILEQQQKMGNKGKFVLDPASFQGKSPSSSKYKYKK